MTVVKICGLTSLEDARHAWQCGADLLGFIFVPASRRYIEPVAAGEIIGALKGEGCPSLCVGVVAGETVEAANQALDISGMDLVQLHGGEPAGYARLLARPVIVVRRITDSIPWEEMREYDAWAYLLDTYEKGALGGTGQAWQWDALEDAPAGFGRLIVAGGLTPDNVAGAVASLNPWGVDVSSGVELAPGKKDFEKVARFIQRAKGEADE